MNHNWEESSEFSGNITFGEFLRKKRRLNYITQEQMADKLGVNFNTISRWEVGVTSPPIDVATEIVKRLGGEVVIMNIPDRKMK